MAISVKSGAFENGGSIPRTYTGDGNDESPPLSWQHLPSGTRELAVICDDPDAPTSQPWVHWVIYKIPAEERGLAAGIPADLLLSTPSGAVQGKNSWKTVGYRGPAPPKGRGSHHYHFKLYALDRNLDLKPGLDKSELLKSIQGHILAEGELTGTYERK